MARFIHEGASIDYTPGTDTAAGTVVVQGDLVGVTARDIPANRLGALAIEGVFDFPKATGASTAIAVGTVLYWDVADVEAKADDESGANKPLGKCVADAADGDAVVRVKLDQ